MTKHSITSSTWSLFLGIALLQAGVGLQRPLLGLRAENAGFSTLTASLVMTLYYAGFIVGTRFVGKALAKVGHIRTFAGLASTASSIVLLQGLWISPISWGLCRLTFGMCCAALYVVAESWLNDLATNESRGRILSVYTVIAVFHWPRRHKWFHSLCGRVSDGLNGTCAYSAVKQNRSTGSCTGTF